MLTTSRPFCYCRANTGKLRYGRIKGEWEEAMTKTVALPDRVRAAIELRRSGAAGKHGDRRTKRNRDRSSKRRNAIAESKAA